MDKFVKLSTDTIYKRLVNGVEEIVVLKSKMATSGWLAETGSQPEIAIVAIVAENTDGDMLFEK